MSPNVLAAKDSEMELIVRLRSGDESAFIELMDRYGASLFRLAQLYVHDAGAAEDVVQETWLGVFQGIDRFEERSSLKTWLFTILSNRAKRRGERDNRTRPFSTLSSPDGIDEGDLDRFFPPGNEDAGYWKSIPDDWSQQPETKLASDELRAVVNHAIAALPGNQREVITMRDIEGWSSDEVRNVLGITETNQRVLLHRARTKVRRAIEEYMAR